MLTRVIQQHANSCVPACVAMLSGLPYQQALKVIYPWKKSKAWNNHGTYHSDMFRALKRLGYKVRKRKPVPLTKLRTHAIVIVEHAAYGPPRHRSHAVVWDYQRQRILDPYVGAKGGLKRHLRLQTYQKSAILIVEVSGGKTRS